jgi:hypothetical protein
MKQLIKNLLREGLTKVMIPPIVLHTSNPIFRESIDREGLIPKQESWGNAIGSDMNKELGDKGVIFVKTDGEPFDHGYDDDVWEIDTTKINNEWFDDEYTNSSKYTFEPIPRSVIRLIYKGTGEDTYL